MSTHAIPGYRITQQLYSGYRSLVFRGISESDNQPVVLKLLKAEYPILTELVQFRNQYAIAKNLDAPGIVKPLRLEHYRNGFVLVMEDNGCVSLSEYVAANGYNTLNTREFLHVAIQIAQTLEYLHRNRIIHKDIKPQNILIHPETKQVKLIDFSISSVLPRESQEITSPNMLQGTLAYMSPEQTGRMNRGIDYRSDFYSLGVTFYELLTGQFPFQNNDPLELVHCHIARMPTPPFEVRSTIGQGLNDIVMKLMAKTAEDRYQSAFGLRADLERCLQEYSDKGSIPPFKLATRDITERFIIPEKLYGREAEVATLLAAFDRVAGKDEEIEETTQSKIQTPKSKIELMLVAGFSGIGKTAVVNEVHKPIVRQRGYFIKGKFDQFKRDIPFLAWVQAFQNLMRQLMSESAASIAQWKAKIQSALGEQGKVIVDVIPELELLIGKQPPVPALEGSAAQNRFNLVFEKFIRVFTTKEHPLVIFLDDLQWADSASLKLMQLLMSESDTRYLLLIGAYRDNEVSPTHPLMLTLNEIGNYKATVNQITLAPLDKTSLNYLVADTLSCPLQRTVPLTELILQKTKGNPFFSNQFLKSLHEVGLIFFDFSSNYWHCDIAKIKSLSVSDDVVEFMATQLQKLPESTQSVLKLASCIGNSFDLIKLAVVYEKSLAETATDLGRALQEGYVIPNSEIYKFFQSDDNGQEVNQLPMTDDQSPIYKFLHERVQQAAYSLIREDRKQATHLEIGRLLLKNTPDEEREEKVFDIVNQLNSGVELIDQQAERDELAQLNLIAGRKAKASTAYTAALRYLTKGIKLLAARNWSLYNLALALHEEAAETAYIIGDRQQAEQLAEVVLQEAKTLMDKMKVYEVKIKAYQTQNKPHEAISTGLSVLALLGLQFPEKPRQVDIQHGLEEIRSKLVGKRIEDLIYLPEMSDREKLAAMRIFAILTPSLFSTNIELLSLLVFKQINLSLIYGNALESVAAYTNYGLILCGIVGNIEEGYQFGQLALSLLERLKAKQVKAKTVFYAYVWTKHWKEHLREGLKHFLDAYSSGLETGDVQAAALSAYLYCTTSFVVGKNLAELRQKMANYSDVLAQLKQSSTLEKHKIYQDAVIRLIELAKKTESNHTMLSRSININHKTASYQVYSTQLILCYLFNDYVTALENAEMAEKFLPGVTSTMVVPIFHLYDSLVRLAVYPHTPQPEQQGILDKVRSNQEKMQKWAHHAPMNYLHKYYLVEAERCRVLGYYMEAMELYDRAIAGAKENEYINEEALANELAAKFYLSWGKQTIAQTYLTNAYYAYARWGALAKVEDLEQRYPQLLAPIKASQSGHGTTALNVISSTTGSAEVLDMATVSAASQALSKEVNLERLLSTLMQVALKNAGASFGALILYDGTHLTLEAIAVSESQAADNPDSTSTVKLLPSLPIDESQEIPVSLINYVARTQEILLLNDATSETAFANDPYIIEKQPNSVLCMPILERGKSSGILYLENNLTTSVFTPDRLEVLKVLSSQAAISIENARLYNNLEQKVADRTQELAQTLEELKATQEELIQKEKMVALGQLIAGIAHEINTPLGAIKASIDNILSSIKSALKQLPLLLQQLSPQQQAEFLAFIESANHKPISSREERQLRRSITRELETRGLSDADEVADALVMMGITQNLTAFLPLLQDSKRELILQVAEHMTTQIASSETILDAVARASKIVFALKSYIHQDSRNEMVKSNIPEEIDTVLILYNNYLKHGIETIRHYGEVPEIICYPEELHQVWTNLIHNAIQAMNYQGQLEISVFSQSEELVVEITDSGGGIPEEIKSKIFSPFFTTKPAGEGSGLGLNIVQKIIARHQGSIEVESQPGNTTFRVILPVK